MKPLLEIILTSVVCAEILMQNHAAAGHLSPRVPCQAVRPCTTTTLYRSPVSAFGPRGCDAVGLGGSWMAIQRDYFPSSSLLVGQPVAPLSSTIFASCNCGTNCTSSNPEAIPLPAAASPPDWFFGRRRRGEESDPSSQKALRDREDWVDDRGDQEFIEGSRARIPCEVHLELAS
ncbi:hypothetical protein QBC44DRAFT_318631 [Cladorrhinum sp. PSN332]|nr:hypothetical protein QBC44DRAFT_318631 [Cladorrhinum sp. PSN332]